MSVKPLTRQPSNSGNYLIPVSALEGPWWRYLSKLFPSIDSYRVDTRGTQTKEKPTSWRLVHIKCVCRWIGVSKWCTVNDSSYRMLMQLCLAALWEWSLCPKRSCLFWVNHRGTMLTVQRHGNSLNVEKEHFAMSLVVLQRQHTLKTRQRLNGRDGQPS